MSAALDDMSVVQYKDLIGVADGFQTVGNHDDGLVMGQCLDTHLEPSIGGDRIKHSHTPPTMREKP